MACLTASRYKVAFAPAFLILFTIASVKLAAGWPQHTSFRSSSGRSLAQDESSETEAEVETPTEPKVSHTSGWNGSTVSVLQNFKRFGKLSLKPYPHVIIRPALDPILYRELDATYPSDDKLLTLAGKNDPDRAQNTRVDLKASTSLFSDEVTDLWKRFIDYHVSREFYQEVEKLFAREISTWHKVKKGYTTALRFGPNTTGANVLMDCQVAINTPVKVKSAVRGPHIDGPAEIYAGLLYFRHHSDQVSKGGDLNICECKRPKCDKMPKKDRPKYGTGDTHYKPSDVYVRGIAPYRANSFALFINSEKAIHAVTPRSVTPYSRRLVNVVAVQTGTGRGKIG